MIDIIFQSSLFGLTLTFGVFIIMSAINRRTGSPILGGTAAPPGKNK